MKTRGRRKANPVNKELFPVVEIEIEDFETVCHVCNAEFLDENDLKVHIAQVHLNESNGRTICKFCCTVLPGAEEFVSHFILKHLEHLSYCFYCYRAFADPLLLDQHELKHCVGVDTTLTCSHCTTFFANRQDLQCHEYNEHKDTEDGFMLNNFFPLLSSALNINIKKFLDSVYKKKKIFCCICRYTSLYVRDFIGHLKTLKCQSYACDKCFNVYKKKNTIANHMQKQPQCQNYTEEKEIHEICPKCEKYFNSSDIRKHKEYCEVVRCLTCKKLFNSIYELTDHRVEKHQVSISLETCKFCKKEFVGMSSLKKHMHRSHKNKSLYKYNCVYCDSMFTHPRKLFAHFFTRHKSIEPYTCKICNKYFRLRKHFTFHIKLLHKSIGFVEFDKNLHVMFTDKKSENPVEPQALVDIDTTTDASDSDKSQENSCSKYIKKNNNQEKCREKEDASGKLNNIFIDTVQSSIPSEITVGSEDSKCTSKGYNDLSREIDEIEYVEPHRKLQTKQKKQTLKHTKTVNTSDEDDSDKEPLLSTKELSSRDKSQNLHQLLNDDSEEESLLSIRQSILKTKTQNLPRLKRRMASRDKRARLTCKICNKYCYTVQNYHHHITLHEKTKPKRCIKCNEYFKSGNQLKSHMDSKHTSSKLIETLKSVLEKRKTTQPAQKSDVRPGDSLKSFLESRKRAQLALAHNTTSNKFRRTIKKVNIVDDCTVTVTPMTDHGLSVKNFIENFKPEIDSVNVSNSVTIKAINVTEVKKPAIKMRAFNLEPPPESHRKLSFPVKFKESPDKESNTVSVKLVQHVLTKPKLVNMSYNERIPVIEEKYDNDEYCNMFADETDYTQYKNDAIPEVAQEVLLGDPEDIPRTRRLAQEIIIPKIPEEYGEVSIGHLLPQAPYYKIVQVKKLLNSPEVPVADVSEKDVKLPDGTRLISVKNPYSHLINNEHLEEVLKANRTRNYTPKTKNIEKAIAKTLIHNKPCRERKGRKKLT